MSGEGRFTCQLSQDFSGITGQMQVIFDGGFVVTSLHYIQITGSEKPSDKKACCT